MFSFLLKISQLLNDITVYPGTTKKTNITWPAGTADWIVNTMDPIIGILQSLLPILLILIGTAGTIYAVVLGVNYARAETSDKREEAKKRMVNAIVGILIMILLIILLQLFANNAGEIVKFITGSSSAPVSPTTP